MAMAAATAVALRLSPFLFLLLCSSAMAASWNIDCGAAAGFVNNLTSQTWLGDGEFVRGGESHVVANTTGLNVIYTTLRAFPKNRKNCYTIPDVPANTRVMARASFRYGNYDGQASPPSFRLQFDAFDLMEVTTTMNTTVHWALIYVTERKGTHVCLGRMNDSGDPFINRLEVVTLEPHMYAKLNGSFALYPLAPAWGYTFGAQEFIGAPDDIYDRWWLPWSPAYSGIIGVSEFDVVKATRRTAAINTSTAVDEPPARLFGSAIAAKPYQNLSITTSIIVDQLDIPFYVNMHFSEIASFPATEKREFDIYRDGQPVALAVSPPVGSALEITDLTANATSSTTYVLAPTAKSTYSPLISAVEMFFPLVFTRGLTSIADINTLSWIQGNLTVLRNWTGDPCVPLNYNWEWTQCSSAQPLRITKLYLGGYGLSGSLPDFSALDAIQTIELQGNNLIGSIPEFLANFPLLEVLNLADNDFSSIPPTLMKTQKMIVNVTGNSKLCEQGKICIYGPFSLESPPPLPPAKQGNSAATTMDASWSQVILLLAIGVVVILM